MIKEIKIGDRFGAWTVVKRNGIWAYRQWICVCDCGVKRALISSAMNGGRTLSCGCMRNKGVSPWKNGSKPMYLLHSKYACIMNRCHNKKNKDYKHYGARGISVCKSWRGNPIVFRKWAMENGWSKGLSIDRIDNDKGYSPSNCRFVTIKKQARNKRNTLTIILDGEKVPILDVIEGCGLETKIHTVKNRIKIGIDKYSAIFTPLFREIK